MLSLSTSVRKDGGFLLYTCVSGLKAAQLCPQYFTKDESPCLSAGSAHAEHQRHCGAHRNNQI